MMSLNPRKPGPVMLDVAGLELSAVDRERLCHPLVGGVILFARNYASPEQLKALTASIRELGEPGLLIAVDHEGGRVQRFREGFSSIGPMKELGLGWDRDPHAATADAERIGRLIGRELRSHDVDFSFTPVLDLDYGASEVIGDRAFHRNPNAVATLAGALIDGLHAEGMAAVGKHYPGHGFVSADSHHDLPVDHRLFAQIDAEDLVPFKRLIEAGKLDGIMPAHVVYPAVDMQPAGFSRIWLTKVLRGEHGFDGIIFSDDLSMAGAHSAGDIVERADAAMGAGCDMVLVCNDERAADDLLSRWRPHGQHQLVSRWERVRGRETG